MSTAVRGLLIGGVIAAVALGAWASAPDDDAGLVIGDTVAADLAALADATYEHVLDAAPAITDCIGSLRLEADPDLSDPALYDQSSGIVYVRVPATAPSLEASLVHEFAHHLELVCESHQSLRSAFLAAQGHSADTPWFGNVVWEDRPSEQFAESVVQVVLGRRSRNQLRLRLTPEAVHVVEAWLTASG